MKQTEMRERAECVMCGRRFGNANMPLFYVVRVQAWGVDIGAMQRHHGLEMVLGGDGRIAQAMGTDEDMANLITEEEGTVCHTCYLKHHSFPQFVEAVGEQQRRKEGE